MRITKRDNLRLKLGNLFLAFLLSSVPTGMTIGFLNVHGLIVCNSIKTRIDPENSTSINSLCINSNNQATIAYIIWIWLFITIPTWRWFYVGHLRRVERDKK